MKKLSNQIEYYTALNSGHDRIKIPISNRNNKELYDGDEIFVKEISQKYKVQLHEVDGLRYNVYILTKKLIFMTRLLKKIYLKMNIKSQN